MKFEARVVRAEGCWGWNGAINANGYGVTGRGGHNAGVILAHRLSWELHNGPIPEGLEVCHRCDNPPCCNPSHLFLGTHSDNMLDMYAKGRKEPVRMFGMSQKNAKLTDEAIADIRARYATGGITQRSLADEYGVSPTAVGYAVRHQTWAHI